MSEKQELWKIMQDINKTWSKGNPDTLTNFFHKDMVISDNDFKKLGVGRKACVESYKSFVSRAKILGVKEQDRDIDIFGNTAYVSYSFEVTYEMDGKEYHDSGRDVFFFTREDDKWLAVWRTITSVK